MNPILFIGLLLTVKKLIDYKSIINWVTLICLPSVFISFICGKQQLHHMDLDTYFP